MTSRDTNAPWWLKWLNSAGVAGLAIFMLFWISNALPFLPMPVWAEIKSALTNHERSTQESLRVQRLICASLNRDNPTQQSECWRQRNGRNDQGP